VQHSLALARFHVIKAGQMEQSMQQIQLQFTHEVAMQNPRLSRGRIRADHDFTVLKCEDIGRAWNAAEFFVQRGHSPITDNYDIDLVERCDLGFWTSGLPYKFASNHSEALQLACRKKNAALNISDGYQWQRR